MGVRVAYCSNRPVKLAALLAVAFGLFTSMSFEAVAQSNLCRQLEAQLVAASSTGKSSQFRKYDRAAKKQRQQLKKAQRRARSAGCSTGVLSIFRNSGNSRQCRSLVSKIGQMERNLGQLERRRARYDGGGSLAKRARLLARLTANGCRNKTQVAKRNERSNDNSRRVSILDQIFRESDRRRRPLDDSNGRRIRSTLNDGDGTDLGSAVGSYRTLCVRTCDGYYFPVSFSATENDFGRDQQACQAMCPGTDVELYYHKVPEEESEDMISVAGEPYAELGTAFLYRQPGYKRDKNCGCSPVKNFSIIAGNEKLLHEQDAEQFIPHPTGRPDPAADPETLANRQGNLSPETIARILAPTPGTNDSGSSGERKVRVVGPVFLPDPEGAIDLQAPARTSVQ